MDCGDDVFDLLCDLISGLDFTVVTGGATEFAPIAAKLLEHEVPLPGEALVVWLVLQGTHVRGGAKGLAEWASVERTVRGWCAPNPDLRALLLHAIRTRQVPIKDAEDIADIDRAVRGEIPFGWQVAKNALEQLAEKGTPAAFMVDGVMARQFSRLHAFLKACDAAGKKSKGENDDRDFLSWWGRDGDGAERLIAPKARGKDGQAGLPGDGGAEGHPQ